MRLIICLLLTLFPISAFSQVPDMTAEYRAKGVASVKSYEYKSKKIRPKRKGKLFSHEILDTNGRATESYTYILGKSHDTYTYNDHGDLVKEETVMFSWSPLIETTSYKYDEAGRILEKKEDARFGDQWNYTYDSLGRLTVTNWLLFGTELQDLLLDSFFYSGDRLIEQRRYRQGGLPYFQMTYSYNAAGQKTGMYRHEHGDTTDAWLYTYDERGREVTTTLYDCLAKQSFVTTSAYNEKGLLTDVCTVFYYRRRPHCVRKVYTYF